MATKAKQAPKKESKEKKEQKSVTLSVADRLILSMMFKNVPQDSLVGFLVGKHIFKKVEFSSEEVEKLELKPEDKGGLKWKPEAAQECEKDVLFTNQEKERIVERYMEIGKNKKALTKVHMALWEKLDLPEPDIFE